MSSRGSVFNNDVSRRIWDTKYRFCSGSSSEQTIQQNWQRVARELAKCELEPDVWAGNFYNILDGFQFLPGGRILAGAGIPQQVTLFNCFVMDEIEDSIDGIFDALKESAITLQYGGGVGCDFSNLRPAGTQTGRTSSIASGPVSFMRIWDSMCATLLSTGVRRGAMMATLRCDHPDIELFISAKHDPDELRHFNLSILITDEFMKAVEQDIEWQLVFPVSHLDEEIHSEIVLRNWHGHNENEPCKVIKTIRARELWQKITRASYDYAEPGVLFIDQINRMNNLGWCEYISATNPCGEIPLPPNGACDLGSINLASFVTEPFSALSKIDYDSISEVTAVAVRMMDNVVDISQFPLPKQQHQAQATRRIGLGVTGLADVFLMLGISYGSDMARKIATEIMQTICYSAYRASIRLAQEKGSFPLLNKARFLDRPFIKSLPEDIRSDIKQYGIRNSHLTAIAPAGTISLLANNVSSGIEPIFFNKFKRKILFDQEHYVAQEVQDYACYLWQEKYGDDSLPGQYVTAQELTPEEHLLMQASVQKYVDSAISKTINIPVDFEFDNYSDIYRQAYDLGLKGCTTFRPNPVTGSILSVEKVTNHCCDLEREID